ncbi:MAG TPA: pectin acetylesterase-family hydrolase [Blastocatellia bacterium]|nr:pectin acetylesterase-family hydrolase [Blastocatellia bacterium]
MKKLLIALFLLPMVWSPVHRASTRAGAEPAPNIAQALACGKIGEAEGVSPGTDLFRVDIDLRNFPNAVCNDGTPATMFVRRFAKKRDKNKWVIFLLGGGNCTNVLDCAERWCSINTGYGANKMSTSFLTAQGAARSIKGEGIFSRDDSINNFAGWNHVYIFYCSSDNWAGSASNVHLSGTDSSGHQLDYSINFRGADILDAVIATLQREPAGEPVSYRDTTSGDDLVLPDIDKAELVLFTGSSAGGEGVKQNVDRVGELLRKTNKNCKKANNCSFVYLGLIDANYPPSLRSVDLTQATFCTAPPLRCTYEDIYVNRWNQEFIATYNARGDESCVKWHQQNAPGTEWMCADSQHVVNNHLTTPLFIRFDLQDPNLSGKFQDQHLTTLTQFGQLTHDQLLAFENLDSFAEEGSARSGGARLSPPGVFGPQCAQHYGLSVSPPFFAVTVVDAGKRYSFHDLLWNWVQGAQPQQLVRAFAGPGPAPDCP